MNSTRYLICIIAGVAVHAVGSSVILVGGFFFGMAAFNGPSNNVFGPIHSIWNAPFVFIWEPYVLKKIPPPPPGLPPPWVVPSVNKKDYEERQKIIGEISIRKRNSVRLGMSLSTLIGGFVLGTLLYPVIRKK